MIRKFILFLTVLVLTISACAPETTQTAAPTSPPSEPTEKPKPTNTPEPTPEPEPLVFTDDLGRTIELAETASAIVTLGPSIMESLFAIGAGELVVGREEYSTFPEEALDIPSVGSLFGDLPAEAILALEPDLVIAPQIISAEQVQALEDLGLTVYWQANPSDFDGLFANLLTLAQLTGNEKNAEELVTSLSERVADVEETMAQVEEMPSVFYELDATTPENPYTVGAGTFIDTIITMSGGSNIGAVLQGEFAQISSEEVINQNPEIILLADAAYGITAESVAARAGWETIVAVKNGSVFPFDPYLVSVPGPRLVDGLEAMAAIIHPDLFE